MSKLAHSHQPTMDEIDRERMRAAGFSEEEILAAEPLPAIRPEPVEPLTALDAKEVLEPAPKTLEGQS